MLSARIEECVVCFGSLMEGRSPKNSEKEKRNRVGGEGSSVQVKKNLGWTLRNESELARSRRLGSCLQSGTAAAGQHGPTVREGWLIHGAT